MSKQMLRSFLGLVMVAGIALALWPLGQSVYANWSQQQLRAEWEQSSLKTEPAQRKKASASPSIAKPKSEKPQAKWPKTRLVIPDADVDVIVLDGWDDNTLKRAPGHLPTSALPGQVGNCAIAGHSNVYGSPFYKINALQPGAPIELRTPQGTSLYRVLEVKSVVDTDVSVIQPSPDPQMPPLLTLVTCTIPRTLHRVVVTATLEPAA
jgi:sortase A